MKPYAGGMVGIFAAVLAPGVALACSVCFSGAGDSAALEAYYTITAFMTGVALLLLVGLYLLVVRPYLGHAGPGENRAEHPAQGAPEIPPGLENS